MKNIEPDYSAKEKEKANKKHENNEINNKRYEDKTIINAARIRDSSKRITDKVNLNESDKDVHELKKTRRASESASLNRCKPPLTIFERLDYDR